MPTSDEGKAAGRKAVEAFAEHTIDPSPEQNEEQQHFQLVYPFSTYSVTPNTPDPAGDNVGKVMSRNEVTGERTCALSELLDFSGFNTTDDTGKVTVYLRGLLCPDESRYFA